MQQSCSNYIAFCSNSRASMQPLQCDLHPHVAEHHGRTDYASKRAHLQPPHTQGSLHCRLQPFYSEKHKVLCSGFLPKTHPMQQPCSHYNAFCTNTCHHFPQSPSFVITLRHHLSSSPCVITLRHHPSSSLTTLPPHFPQSPPLRHHPSSSPFIIALRPHLPLLSPFDINHHFPLSPPFVRCILLCDVLLCDVL